VEHDDPALTTRLVDGPSPTRLVLDPALWLGDGGRLFLDGAAPTLVLCRDGAPSRSAVGRGEVRPVAGAGELIDAHAVVALLRERGLTRVLVEGGGITVSEFLAKGALDRLHVTVSSVFLGNGRPGVLLPGIDDIEQALRPRTRRFLMGDDVLFDCAFRH
jgi:riboflavin biosynthesis pyrimidine reductase